ncbi:hypothetical protein ACFFX0_20965 [Citricoccus parietis]|uniref:Uncharacterized protein n=1 Tax=Citricoccus parietis TaxID=592307 RepID=A0ABV5G3N1_9MICC
MARHPAATEEARSAYCCHVKVPESPERAMEAGSSAADRWNSVQSVSPDWIRAFPPETFGVLYRVMVSPFSMEAPVAVEPPRVDEAAVSRSRPPRPPPRRRDARPRCRPDVSAQSPG